MTAQDPDPCPGPWNDAVGMGNDTVGLPPWVDRLPLGILIILVAALYIWWPRRGDTRRIRYDRNN